MVADDNGHSGRLADEHHTISVFYPGSCATNWPPSTHWHQSCMPITVCVDDLLVRLTKSISSANAWGAESVLAHRLLEKEVEGSVLEPKLNWWRRRRGCFEATKPTMISLMLVSEAMSHDRRCWMLLTNQDVNRTRLSESIEGEQCVKQYFQHGGIRLLSRRVYRLEIGKKTTGSQICHELLAYYFL